MPGSEIGTPGVFGLIAHLRQRALDAELLERLLPLLTVGNSHFVEKIMDRRVLVQQNFDHVTVWQLAASPCGSRPA